MRRDAVLSITIWAWGAACTIILFFVMLATIVLFPFDRKRRILHSHCYWWSDAVLAINPSWKVSVYGLDNVDKRRTYVIVSNHLSMADVVVLYQLKIQFKWVAKDSLFRVPFLGWNLSLARHIRLYRGKLGSVKRVYREAAGWLRSGVSVFFFPEGTRSETGEMREFQNGAFKLAIKERVPVLPVRLEGTGEVMRKGGWKLNPSMDCRIRVLPAVETGGFEAKDYEKLKALVRAEMDGPRT